MLTLNTQFHKGSYIDAVTKTVMTPTLVNFVKARKGMAVEFNDPIAATNNVNTNIPSNQLVGANCAIEAWFNSKRASVGTNYIIMTTRGVGSTFMSLLVVNNLLRAYFANNAGGVDVSTLSGAVLQDRDYHCLFVRENTSTLRLYINNVLVGTTNTGGQSPSNNNATIGSVADALISPFKGSIYKVRSYNHVPTQKEMDDMYQEFINSKLITKPIRGFVKPRPIDLSREKDGTVGDNLILNGTFDNNSSWTLATGCIISGGKANFDGTSGNSLFQSVVGADSLLKSYMLTFDITDYTSGTIIGRFGGTTGTAVSGVGRYTLKITGGTNNNLIFQSNSFIGSIDNVILKEVTGLVAAYNMKNVRNISHDLSGNGRHLALTNTVNTNKGLYFNPVNCGAVASYATPPAAGSICLRANIIDITTDSFLFRTNPSGSLGMDILVSAGNIRFQVKATGAISSVISANTDFTVTITWLLGGTKSLYVNGVLVGSNAYTTAFDELGLSIGGNFNASSRINGFVNDFKMYNRVISLNEIKAYHNSFVTPTLIEDFSSYGVGSTPDKWTQTSGSYSVREDVILPTPKINAQFTSNLNSCVSIGNYNATWENGYARIIAGGAFTAGVNEFQTPSLGVTLGKVYKIEALVKSVSGNTSFTATLDFGGTVTQTISTTEWTYVSLSRAATATNTGARLRCGILGAGEFLIDSIIVTEVPPLNTFNNQTKYLECTTAGVIAIPSKQAYGTWEFDVYKQDVSTVNVQFASSASLLFTAPVNGYTLQLSSSEQVRLLRTGAFTELFGTPNSYIQNATWYRIKITRTTTGIFTVLIKGGAFTPTAGYDGWTLVSTTGGSGTNPVTDNTYTTSNYLVLDLDAGDRIANIKLLDGIIQ